MTCTTAVSRILLDGALASIAEDPTAGVAGRISAALPWCSTNVVKKLSSATCNAVSSACTTRASTSTSSSNTSYSTCTNQGPNAQTLSRPMPPHIILISDCPSTHLRQKCRAGHLGPE